MKRTVFLPIIWLPLVLLLGCNNDDPTRTFFPGCFGQEIIGFWEDAENISPSAPYAHDYVVFYDDGTCCYCRHSIRGHFCSPGTYECSLNGCIMDEPSQWQVQCIEANILLIDGRTFKRVSPDDWPTFLSCPNETPCRFECP